MSVHSARRRPVPRRPRRAVASLAGGVAGLLAVALLITLALGGHRPQPRDGTAPAGTSAGDPADGRASGSGAERFGPVPSRSNPSRAASRPPRGRGDPIASRPNDGSGYWPDFSNTGYSHTPVNPGGLRLRGYPGHLTDHTSGMDPSRTLTLRYPNGSVISYRRFLAQKVIIYGDNLTFVGCLFEGRSPNDNMVQIYAATRVHFLYSTFKPAGYTRPPGNDGTVSSAHQPPGTPFDRSWQYVTTMNDAVSTMDHNDIWGNAGMEMVTSHPGAPSVWTNNYIHDAADTGSDTYHHDGIGPQSEGDGGPMTIRHNTIASLGNTNALALQGDGVYDNIKFTDNYLSGYGYAVSIGVRPNATNIRFTGNVFSAELTNLFGPLYGNLWGGNAQGSTWRGNFYQVRERDDNQAYRPTDNGRYWWPTDNKPHTTDYTG